MAASRQSLLLNNKKKIKQQDCDVCHETNTDPTESPSDLYKAVRGKSWSDSEKLSVDGEHVALDLVAQLSLQVTKLLLQDGQRRHDDGLWSQGTTGLHVIIETGRGGNEPWMRIILPNYNLFAPRLGT